MINIEERLSKKSVGKTSLFVSFNYNANIVEAVKSTQDACYDKNSHEWELPLTKLLKLIDTLTYFDDINIKLLELELHSVIKQCLDHSIKPFKHLSEGIDWIINRNSGLILDAPGLGKSLQIIYSAEELKKQKGILHCLIVCCINTLKLNWKKEIQKFSTELVRVIGEKVNRKGAISYASVGERAEELYNPIEEFFIIINVECLRDSTVVAAIQNSKNKFDMIVVDECHKCKDVNSQQGKGLLKLAKVGIYHYGLTGTVLINSPFDAFAALKFIGEEKTSFSNFKLYYGRFESKFGHMQLIGYKNIDSLKAELTQCSIRRTKDILELPPKIIVPEYLEMDQAQYNFYNNIQKGVIEEADRVNIKTTSLLGLVTRLRQAATCPSVLSTLITSSIKLDRCCELVDEILDSGEKVVIFSTFKEPLYTLEKLLKKYSPVICTGDQEDMEISNLIDKFLTDQNTRIILCTTSKMGTGITLTAASYEIFLDSSWTAAMETQAEDRCYRIGSKKSVTVYKLIAKDTIDERIQDILKSKLGISDLIVDDNYNQTEELKNLLGLNLSRAW